MTLAAQDDAGARDAIVAALLVASGGDCRRLRWLCDFWLVDQRARALRVADLVRAILDSTTDHVGGTHAIVVPSTWTGVPMARCSLDAAVNDASVRVVADESAPRTHGEVRARLLHYLALVEAFTALDVRPRHVDRDIDAAAELALVDAWLASVAGCASGGEPASCAGVRRAVDRAALPCELSIAMYVCTRRACVVRRACV